MLTIQSLGLQENSKLMAAIALTFAIDVLDVYEKEYPTDRRLHSTIEYCVEVLLDKEKGSQMIRSWVGYDTNEICSAKIHTKKSEVYAAACTILNAFYISTHESDYNLKEFSCLIVTAANAQQNPNVGLYVHSILFPILPLIVEYKLQNLEHFGDLEIVWEYLTDEQKDLVIFNLDILAIRLRKKELL